MTMKRTLCALLSAVMLLSTISMTAFAEDMADEATDAEATAAVDNAVSEEAVTASGDEANIVTDDAEISLKAADTVSEETDAEAYTEAVIDESGEEAETIDEAAILAADPELEAEVNAAGADVGSTETSLKAATSVTKVFNDISSSAWYVSAIQFVYNKGMMSGTSATTFAPNASLSRAQIVQILYKRAGSPGYPTTQKFSDVPSSAWYFPAIQWAASIGVVSGVGSGKFQPTASVTREQLAVILYNYFGSSSSSTSLSSFADSDKVSSWAKSAMRWAVAMNVINGSKSGGKTYLKPKNTTTRAESAQMMMNMLTKAWYDVDLQTNYPYSEYNWTGGSGKTIYTSACGPSALRNILVNLCGINVTISDMCKLCQSSGARVDGGTLAYTMLEAAQSKYGGFTYSYTTDDAKARAHVANGGMALCHTNGKNKVFSTGGHFVAMSGVTGSKMIIIDSYITDSKWTNYNRSSYVTQTLLKGVVTASTTTTDASFDYYYLISKT